MLIPKVTALLFMKKYSERVKNKNIRKFCGKPLFYYIFDTLKESKYISQIILNTDSKTIAKSVTDLFNVKIHFRPEHLLKINSNEANQIMEYDISLCEGDYFFQTHSTNPLLTVESIDKSIETFFSNKDKYDSLFSVNKYQSRFYYETGVGINHKKDELIKTQDLPVVYEENSCIYIFSRRSFSLNKNRIGQSPMFFPLSYVESCDIDTDDDFKLAEFFMKKKMENL